MKFATFILALINSLVLIRASDYLKKEEQSKYWMDGGQERLRQSLKTFENLNKNRAKNVIVMIGDGMNLGTVTAGRIAIGQTMPLTFGEEHVTSLDEAPHVGIAKTYSVNYMTPDSAATATAILSGVKTRSGRLGVNAKAFDCATSLNNSVETILDLAIKQGKSVGVVTTTRVQHATPAAAYAKVPNRKWYSDDDLSDSDKRAGCVDISMQLYNRRNDIQVVLGGGRAYMRSIYQNDEEYRETKGERRDYRDLIHEWRLDMKEKRGKYVWNKKSFDEIDPENTDYLLGLFSPYDMHYSFNKNSDRGGEPTLSEMTEKAIKILQKNDNGFFLLVESGMLDKCHHQSRARCALTEFKELETSLTVARKNTNSDDTMIITTSDHGHMFNFGAGSYRGADIFGLAPSNSNPRKAVDGKYFTIISYGNGPGHIATKLPRSKEKRQAISTFSATSKYYQQQSAVPLHGETHSAEDVAVFAEGPFSHLISGVFEQNYIAHAMFYAACLGDYANHSHCRPDIGSGYPVFSNLAKTKNPPIPNEELEPSDYDTERSYRL